MNKYIPLSELSLDFTNRLRSSAHHGPTFNDADRKASKMPFSEFNGGDKNQ